LANPAVLLADSAWCRQQVISIDPADLTCRLMSAWL